MKATKLIYLTMKVAVVVVVLLLHISTRARASPHPYEYAVYEPNKTNPIGGASMNYSAKAQATYRLTGGGTAVDPPYEKNVKTYWAYVSPAGRNKSVLSSVNYEDFEGILAIAAGSTLDSNSTFGPYNAGQGMLNIGIGNGIVGGGACNTNGMLAQSLWYSGWFRVTVTCLGHPAMPGVESRFWSTVQSGTSCTVKAENVSGKNLWLHWRIIGDTITLWVDDNPEMTGTAPALANIPSGSSGASTTQVGLNDLPIESVELELIMSEDTVFPEVAGPDPTQAPTALNPALIQPTATLAPYSPVTTTAPQHRLLPLPLYLGEQQLYLDLRLAVLVIVATVGTLTIVILYFQFPKK